MIRIPPFRPQAISTVIRRYEVSSITFGAKAVDINRQMFDTMLSSGGKRTPAELKAFLDQGASVGDENRYGGKTMLMHFIAYPNLIKTLLAAGANPRALVYKSTGETLLMSAYYDHKTMKVLVNPGIKGVEGVPIDETDKKGRTALFYTIEQGRMEGIKTLLGLGANVNHRDKQGNTPLIVSCSWEGKSPSRLNNTPEVQECLLQAKADINARNKKGQTALDLAERDKRPEVVAFLRGRGAKYSRELDAE